MRIKKLKLSEIIPYENNPRINDGAVDAVAESIRQCTYITPIILDENKVILAGHTRYKALKKLKVDAVPCLICEGLTEEQKKKYRYLDNKTGEKATWDFIKLEMELEKIDLDGFDFFGVDNNSAEPQEIKESIGVTEYETEAFGDAEYKYECPACGFRFD